MYFGLSAATWMRLAVIVALFSALFWPNLRRLWQKTNPFTGEANWGHAICVPIIGLYYLYVHREDLESAGSRSFVWGPFQRPARWLAGLSLIVFAAAGWAVAQTHGSHSTVGSLLLTAAEATGLLGALVLLVDWSLASTLFGIGVFVYGIYPGQNDYLKDLGMVITLFGIVLMMNGPAVMKIAWFPIAFLICAIPWPGLVYSWIAGPLQELAANVAVLVLKVTGVEAVNSGTKIIIYGVDLAHTRVLNVAEACAGMRSLMTFIAVGGAVGFLSQRPLWQKIIITLSAIPIAIFCNVMRVSGQGLLDHYFSQKLSESFAHQFVGMIMLVPAFFLILAVGFVLDRIFIEEVDENETSLKTYLPVNGTVTALPVAPQAPFMRSPVVAPARPVNPAAPVRVPTPTVAPQPVTSRVPIPAAGKVAAIPARPPGIPPMTSYINPTTKKPANQPASSVPRPRTPITMPRQSNTPMPPPVPQGQVELNESAQPTGRENP